jgi:hypothetical protein
MQKLAYIVFSKVAAVAFSSQIFRKDNGGSSCENSKIGNKSFHERREVDKQQQQSISFFQTIMNSKYVGQIFTYRSMQL